MIVDLNLKGKQVLVVGGGNEAARKVEALLTQQCDIFVVAESAEPSIKQHADIGKITLELRKIENVEFLDKYSQLILVLATTDDRELNRKIVHYAKSKGCYTYATDDPEVSDFSHPAVINIGDTVQVAISTGGKSPLMAKALREKIEPVIQTAVDELILNQIKLQEQLRIAAQEILPSPDHRKRFLVALRDDEEVIKLLDDKLLSEANALAHVRLEQYVLTISSEV